MLYTFKWIDQQHWYVLLIQPWYSTNHQQKTQTQKQRGLIIKILNHMVKLRVVDCLHLCRLLAPLRIACTFADCLHLCWFPINLHSINYNRALSKTTFNAQCKMNLSTVQKQTFIDANSTKTCPTLCPKWSTYVVNLCKNVSCAYLLAINHYISTFIKEPKVNKMSINQRNRQYCSTGKYTTAN